MLIIIKKICYNKIGDDMDINNVVLVRAMGHLPLDGNLIPSCDGQRLVPDKSSDFVKFMNKKVRQELRNNLGRDLDIYYESPDSKLFEEMLNKYRPLTGDYYTTTLSFSLNGMVPDDINNNFSDMKIAIIDPIKNHVDADFVTIDAIDTTIKGNLKVSDEGHLLIETGLYNSLSPSIVDNLKTNYNLVLFEGNLRSVVDNVLRDNNYPVLPLIQKREMKNIDECQERESMLAFEDKFATMVNASRLSLQNLTFSYQPTSNEVDSMAHEKLAEEFPNTLKIQNHYRNQLYEFLLNKADLYKIKVTEEQRYYLFTDYSYGSEAMEEIVSEIIVACGGIEKFAHIINEYNQYAMNNYLTNRQIIESNYNSKAM